MDKQLKRSRSNRMFAGVCGGLGDYLGVDPVMVRLLWAIFTVFSFGTGLLIYILAWVIVPEE
ncbi:PspC domain-containing protein [Methanolobus sp. ZRKC3]|uniref:PspC domain-containing protein n=1 Tax=Methanolobus sp. ZRKC3 TaxID=3125786 RepID=UPI003253D3C9